MAARKDFGELVWDLVGVSDNAITLGTEKSRWGYGLSWRPGR